MRLVGIAQDDLADGSGKAGFSFLSTSAVGSGQIFSDKRTNMSWEDSNLRSKLQQVFNSGLTATDNSNMKRYIKSVVKKATLVPSADSNVRNEITTKDSIWTPSTSELLGYAKTTEYNVTNSGEQYDYFKDNSVGISNVESDSPKIVNPNVIRLDGVNANKYTYWTRTSTSLKYPQAGNTLNDLVVIVATNNGINPPGAGDNNIYPIDSNNSLFTIYNYPIYYVMGFCI